MPIRWLINNYLSVLAKYGQKTDGIVNRDTIDWHFANEVLKKYHKDKNLEKSLLQGRRSKAISPPWVMLNSSTENDKFIFLISFQNTASKIIKELRKSILRPKKMHVKKLRRKADKISKKF